MNGQKLGEEEKKRAENRELGDREEEDKELEKKKDRAKGKGGT